jgi:sulfate permease, SulP family
MKTRSEGFKAKPLFRPRLLEIFSRHYGRNDLLADVLSGITVGLIALPLALALGIASVPPGTPTPYPPPATGLFTAIFAGLVISALGGSRVQIGGPTAAFIPIVLLIIEKHGYSGLVLATLMAGGILVVMGFARMGTLIKFIPWPVTSGFTTGIAVSIMATQAADFLGIHAQSPQPREFLHKLHWLWENVSHFHLASLGLAVACALLIGFWPRLGLKHVPGSVVAMLAAAAAIAVFGLDRNLGLATIGSKFGMDAIPIGLPPFQWPDISLDRVRSLIEPAMTIALLGAIESLLSAVVADGLSGDRHDSNTELVAQGIANIVCPFFGGRNRAQPHALAHCAGLRPLCRIHPGRCNVRRPRDGRVSNGRMA